MIEDKKERRKALRRERNKKKRDVLLKKKRKKEYDAKRYKEKRAKAVTKIMAKKEARIREAKKAATGYLSRIIIEDGHPVEIYTGDFLCTCLGVTKSSYYKWISKGILPEPTMIDSSGTRWYSKKYVDTFYNIYTKQGKERINVKELKRTLKDQWPD